MWFRDMRADKETNKHTDTLIAILFMSFYRGAVETKKTLIELHFRQEY